jgi:uncharacterized damage-inducible protein DinB
MASSMIAKDILVSFLEYNYSANEHMLEQVEQLTPDQLHAVTKISHGTAFDLVRHMLDTEWSWRLFARGEAGQKYLWEVEQIPDLPAVRRFWVAERTRMLEYVSSLSEADLDRAVDYGTAQGGQPRYSKVWQILLHVVNHSTHHRSELSRYLEDCGHPVDERDLDFGSFVEWTDS